MPNWIEGTLKFRGTREQLLDMLKNGLGSVASLHANSMKVLAVALGVEKVETPESNTKETDIEIIETDDEIGFKSEEGVVFKGIRRAFSESNEEIYLEEEENEKHIFLFRDFRAAWGVEPKELLAFCQKFNVDAYFHGYEQGMEFEQAIEIVDGKIVKSHEIKYDDYQWECPFPHLGG